MLRLGPCDPDRLGQLCLRGLVWSTSLDQVSTLAAERNELIAERNDALTKLDQLQRSVGNLKQVETKLSAARAEQNRVVELTESKAQIATAKDEIAGLIKRIKQAENPERVPGTGSTPQVETATQRSR